jgi:hypothetical protein
MADFIDSHSLPLSTIPCTFSDYFAIEVPLHSSNRVFLQLPPFHEDDGIATSFPNLDSLGRAVCSRPNDIDKFSRDITNVSELSRAKVTPITVRGLLPHRLLRT